MTALVTCGHTRAALAAARSLGRAGLAVAVGAQQRPALAMWSRYSTSTLLLPAPQLSPESFADTISKEVAGRCIQTVFPGTDDALWAMSKWRHAFPDSVLR